MGDCSIFIIVVHQYNLIDILTLCLQKNISFLFNNQMLQYQIL